jgi:sugar lactone lactonase YvrE
VILEGDATVCSESVAEHGEGPIWDERRNELLWVDIGAGRLHRGRPGPGGVDHLGTLAIGEPLGAVALARGGGWVVAAGPGFALLEPDGALTWLARPEDGRPEMRMNDGACDPTGRFWAGSMAYDATPGAGTLYRLDPDGSASAVVTGTTISNGLGWSADGKTMWFADSGPGTVDAFDFDLREAMPANRRTVVEIDPADGVPDGLTIDAEDHLWVAVWDGGEVRRYTPGGELVARVRVPVTRPTSCCHGGPGLTWLFISTAREGLTDDELRLQPEAGRLFCAQVGVPGVRADEFGAVRKS